MAIRIPIYERHVQLDAAAQTIPRYTADTSIGRGLIHAGDAMMKLAAHWQQKEDQFDKLQLHQQEALLHERIRVIYAEEGLKFDPGRDRPGTLHNRIMSRVNDAVVEFKANAPQSQRKEAEVKGNGILTTQSIGAAQVESNTTNQYAKNELDRRVGKIIEQVQANPDSGHGAVSQVDQEISSLDKLGTLTAAQKRSMRDGYMSGISNAAQKGFATQGRTEDGKAFADQFAKDRERESPVQFQNREVPGTRPLPSAPTGKRSEAAPVDPAKYDTKLTPDEEKNFQAWKAKNAPNDSGQDYDLRGAFKAGVTPDPQSGHMPDTFKKPNHPTFSVESQYAKERPDLAGRWDGQTYVPPIKGSIPAAGARTGYAREVTPAEEKLNEKRIAEIDKKPEIKAAIEKVAQETGMDPKVLKVAASIESDGNPNQKSPSGEHHGLFQLTTAEMGMHGKVAEINNPEANARAYVAVLQRNAPQLEQALGRPPTDKELYLSHQQGVGGTVAHLKNPDQPAWKTMLSTSEGQQKGEAWAKKAVEGNIPKDVLNRLYGGDATKVTSAEMVAIQGTRFTGGNIDVAVTDVRLAPKVGERQTITADASGRVIDTDQNQQPRSIIGGVDAGGPAQPPQAFSVGGLRTQIAYQPGQQFGKSATAAAEPFKAIILHHTGGETLQSALATARNENRGYTFIIDKDGTVYQAAPLDARTNHIKGPGSFPVGMRTARPDINNNNAMGIAYVGSGPANPEQLKSGHALVAGVQNLNPNAPIKTEDVLGHGEVQGGDRSKDEAIDLVKLVRSGAPAPVLTGDDGSGRPAAPANLSRWQMDAERQKTALDGAAMKGAAVRTEFDRKLKSTLDADIRGIAADGTPVKLSKDMQDYFKTDKLSFDFVSNRLGTAAAITWQDSRQNAQKYYEATNNFNLMSTEAIAERLNSLKPQPGSANRAQEEKLYTAAYKTWLQIDKTRNADPAAAADKFPDVAAAKAAAYADPSNMQKAQELTLARMKAENFLGINPNLHTPINKDEARTLAAPLTALTDPDQTHSVAAAAVAKNVMKIVGNDPDLGTKAMETVLRERRITKETAAVAAAQLQATKDAMKDPYAAMTPEQKTAQKPATDYHTVLSGYDTRSTTEPWAMPFDTAAEGGGGREGSFVEGRDVIPEQYIKTLLANKDSQQSRDFFNQTYGQGAAEYFIDQDKRMSSSQQVEQPPVVAADQSDFAFPLPTPEVTSDTTPPDQSLEF